MLAHSFNSRIEKGQWPVVKYTKDTARRAIGNNARGSSTNEKMFNLANNKKTPVHYYVTITYLSE